MIEAEGRNPLQENIDSQANPNTLGIIFGETSTREFYFLFGDADGQRQNQLKFAYVQVDLQEEGRIVVASVVDVNTDNPLLAKDTAKFYSEGTGITLPDLMSRRFTLYQAKCEVIGIYDNDRKEINPLTQPIKPGEKVELLSEKVLNELFSENVPWHLRLGYVETPGIQTQAQVSLNADSILTMHASVFGMTGMGKTTTTAVLLEELMFRGAKTIVFDPHADYVNLDQMRQRLYEDHFQDRVENDLDLKKKISEYRDYMRERWGDEVTPWNDFDSSYNGFESVDSPAELTDKNIFYRWLNFCVIKDRNLMIDFARAPSDLDNQLDNVINRIRELNLGEEVPNELVGRRLAIKFKAFPTIQVYEDKSPYFTMRLIEAIAGEAFTEAQEGYMIDWLTKLPQNRDDLADKKLLDHLNTKVNGMQSVNNRPNPSQAPLKRIINKANRSIKSLIKRGCKSLDVTQFVNDFCKKTGKLSKVTTAIFDLSDLENDHARRALIYAVMEFVFDRYKSKHFVMGENAHPVLFALEEARTLIPRQEESSTTGEMHPATRAARLAARQIATEGRKMGLGMLVISQKPASVDPLTVSQANTMILHRVINPDDQTYIRTVSESLSNENLNTLKTVDAGVAIVTGNALKTSEMSPLVKIRDRYSEPGTPKPNPIETLWKERS